MNTWDMESLMMGHAAGPGHGPGPGMPYPPGPPGPPPPPMPGAPPFGAPPGLQGGPPGAPFGGGPRVRRGDVRAAALALLAEGPRNGYQIIQEIAARSHGIWRPSPGSVYPALQQLEDEGLVLAEEEGGRRVYRLTGQGRRYVDEHRGELAEPWAAVAGSVTEEMVDMRSLLFQVTMAIRQVAEAGDAAQHNRARAVLSDTRRALYRILAEEEDA